MPSAAPEPEPIAAIPTSPILPPEPIGVEFAPIEEVENPMAAVGLLRPVLDVRIEVHPEIPPTGYPWYAYYGARFAWRDERTTLLRGVLGTGQVTTYNRPETPDFLELRAGRQNTVILPGGLPFHQRHGSRMLDLILLPEGETGRAFELALALDREYPMQTALGMVTRHGREALEQIVRLDEQDGLDERHSRAPSG